MIGFIGCGNMAKAVIKGLLDHKISSADNLIASAATDLTRRYITDELGIELAKDNPEVVLRSNIVFLAVKPQVLPSVIREIKGLDLSGKTFVSMAPGKSFDWFNDTFGKPVALIRTAPNTPLKVSAGMTSLCANALTAPDRLDVVRNIFDCLGRTAVMDEKLLDVALAVSGSSPAFVYIFIEALADGAVAEGMPRAQAYELAAQSVLGSGKMVIECGKVPAQLKDEVTSPGGTTIEGINILEAEGFRGIVMDAVRECVAKSREL